MHGCDRGNIGLSISFFNQGLPHLECFLCSSFGNLPIFYLSSCSLNIGCVKRRANAGITSYEFAETGASSRIRHNTSTLESQPNIPQNPQNLTSRRKSSRPRSFVPLTEIPDLTVISCSAIIYLNEGWRMWYYLTYLVVKVLVYFFLVLDSI